VLTTTRVLVGAALLLVTGLAWCGTYVDVPGGTFASVLGNDASDGQARVEPHRMRTTPVTRGEFDAFLAAHPEWRRENAPRAFVDADYLAEDGASASTVGDDRPVTRVSWFAAEAFCEAEGARLPTWLEWEHAAAADATRPDARDDPAWRATILRWYSRPATQSLPAVGATTNVYGIADLHGVVWEWVEDFNALLVDADSRSADDPDKLKFCGAGAINLQQRENYAVLMRVALLSSLKATDSTSSLGFRCVRPSSRGAP
jgi:formylglycine-generating enzyme required for sulfatase activity